MTRAPRILPALAPAAITAVIALAPASSDARDGAGRLWPAPSRASDEAGARAITAVMAAGASAGRMRGARVIVSRPYSVEEGVDVAASAPASTAWWTGRLPVSRLGGRGHRQAP